MTGLLDDLRAQLEGAYRIDRELGGGGMSRVFIAEEIALGRQVVLKVLAPDLSHVLSAERFEREMRVAARLQHPHIVPLLAAGRAGDVLYYTMPLVEGESLRARIDQHGELPVAEAARLFREVADALVYAHREGVVHRDIKPDNILLSHRHAMVTDFGVARAVSEAVGGATLTQTGMAVGTPAYMAPEQAAAVAHRSSRRPLRAGPRRVRDARRTSAVPREHAAGARRGAHDADAAAARGGAALGSRRSSRRSSTAVSRSAPRTATRMPRSWSRHSTASRRRRRTSASRRRPAHAPISRRALLASGAALGLLAVGFGGGFAAFRGADSRSPPSYRRLTFRRGMIRTARFGPDFQTILYGALWDGDDCRVYTVRSDSPESSALALPTATPLAVSSSGELALALGTHARGIMTYGTLARVPLSGGAPRELHENVKYADWLPDGRELAIVRRVAEHDQLEFPAGKVVAQPETPEGGFSFLRVSPRGDAVAAFELVEREQSLRPRRHRRSRRQEAGGVVQLLQRVRARVERRRGVVHGGGRVAALSQHHLRDEARRATCASSRACRATRASTTSRPMAACSSRGPTIAAASPCAHRATRRARSVVARRIESRRHLA